jgi:hypothetical protein
MVSNIIIQSLKICVTTTITITAQHRFLFGLGILYTKQKFGTSNYYKLEKNGRIALLRTYLYSSMPTDMQAGEQPSSCVPDLLKRGAAHKTGTFLAH